MKFSTGLACALLIGITGCNELEQQEEDMVPFTNPVHFKIYEDYNFTSIGDPKLTLNVSSVERLPCSNYEFSVDVQIGTNRIDIEILGIRAPRFVDCQEDNVQAGFVDTLDISPGEYALSIIQGINTDLYVLSLTDTSIAITEISATNSESDIDLLWRFPPNTFAYVRGKYEPFTDRYEYLFTYYHGRISDDILEMEGIEIFTFPQSGVAPDPVTKLGFSNPSRTVYFTYDSTETYAQIGSKIRNYRQSYSRYQQYFAMYLVNSRNEWY